MKLRGIAVIFQFPGDEAAGAVDVGEAVVKAVAEKGIDHVVHAGHLPHTQGIGDVFRLDVKSSCMGDPQPLRIFSPDRDSQKA